LLLDLAICKLIAYVSFRTREKQVERDHRTSLLIVALSVSQGLADEEVFVRRLLISMQNNNISKQDERVISQQHTG